MESSKARGWEASMKCMVGGVSEAVEVNGVL
jgi:hypothetical protein